ncbi:MAG: hypothetical protein AUJ51_04705 [Elusimicrobia bacterium CG1_02_56_21]|nr:MAG: hypothetical protein AUJ51_04705 [Elusimicrobia bacterium CG1_02_56_21]
MRNNIISLIFFAAVFCAPVAAGTDREKERQAAEMILDQAVTRPVKEVILPAVNNAVAAARASVLSLKDLLRGLAEQQKSGGKPDPDILLVETFIRLTMRCNTGDLCLKFSSSCKAYPEDKDFKKAAEAAYKEIKAYADRLKGRSPEIPPHNARIRKYMEKARKRMVFSLPLARKEGAAPGPETQTEAEYLQEAGKKKADN